MELRALLTRRDNRMMDDLLRSADIAREEGLVYCCGLFENDALIACGSYADDTIKCVAVDPARRGEAFMNTIVSHLYTRLRQEGANEVFIFTKRENAPLFRALGFSPLACAQGAILLTSRPEGILEYIMAIREHSPAGVDAAAIVMNANPFTCGHRYLIERAASETELLHVFVVQENKSAFPFETRLRLIKEGTADIPNVHVHPGGRYIISAVTFPSYFIKDPSGAAGIHAALDAMLFCEKIAPALGIRRRFVGTEPHDPLTALYNDTLKSTLPAHGIAFTQIERIMNGGVSISASRVRSLIKEGHIEKTQALVPKSTYAFFLSEEGRALFARWET